jgi:hypothetical protein
VAIRIPFAAEVREFLAGTKQLEDSLDDVADSLDDISTAGSDVDAKVGGDLQDTARTADAAAEKISKSFKTAFHEVEAAGRTSSRKVKADVADVGDKGSATLREFNAEAKQNVAETVSSFDGSASSAVDAVQGTFGGLVAALGPAGVVGAAVVGIGIGLARNMFSKSQEAAEAFRERVLSIFEELRESGDISPEFKSDTLAGIISDAKKLKEAFGTDDLSDFQEMLEATGLSAGKLQTYFSGLTGDADELADAQTMLTQQLDYLRAALLDPSASASQKGQIRQQVEAIATLRTALADQGSAYGDARAKAELLNKLMPESTAATDDNTGAVQDNTDALGDNNEELERQAGLTGDAVAAQLDMKDALADVAEAHKKNGDSLSTSTRAGRDNIRALLSAITSINKFGDAQIEAGKDTKAVNARLADQESVLVRKVMKAFGLTEKQARDYITTLGGIPKKKETEVKVTDKGTAKTTSDKVDAAAADRTASVVVRPDLDRFDSDVKRYLNGKAYFVRMVPRPGQKAAE